ncbi:methyltransferase [Streptomyces sp. NBC_01754]|uniref:methyltransferase n=1 Tax=Streptomyces sp. NBC_01754 TaxID=2975930 RepID=UPI002DDA5E58|nr:methyltransferase [Streptomyces sp. NBC_01754]WSC90847.1 methyltransferase [Streptomyces sp. NBC_01754]WSC96658.1 methyltransferase [Streptomyces sp. NBC_01754]
MSAPPWSRELMRKSDLITPMAIRAAATLRLSDYMAAGAVTAAALARAASVDPGALRRLLGHLVNAGVYRTTSDGGYELTELGTLLRGDVPGSGRDWLALDGPISRGDLAFFRLLDAVRTGKSVYSLVYGSEFWEDLEADPALAQSFARRMAASMEWVVPALVSEGDWEGVRHVVDVGGGSGTLLAAVVGSRPGMRGTLVDLERPAAAAERDFAAAGLGERCTAVVGSFFDPLPAGADVYLLANVLLNWPDERAVAILRRCAEAVAPGGRVMVLEGLLDVQTDQTDLDLRMLVYLDGRMRTAEELRGLGAESGLALRRVAELGPVRSLAEFTPA